MSGPRAGGGWTGPGWRVGSGKFYSTRQHGQQVSLEIRKLRRPAVEVKSINVGACARGLIDTMGILGLRAMGTSGVLMLAWQQGLGGHQARLKRHVDPHGSEQDHHRSRAAPADTAQSVQECSFVVQQVAHAKRLPRRTGA